MQMVVMEYAKVVKMMCMNTHFAAHEPFYPAVVLQWEKLEPPCIKRQRCRTDRVAAGPTGWVRAVQAWG